MTQYLIFSLVKAMRLEPATFLSASTFWVPTRSNILNMQHFSNCLNPCPFIDKDKNLMSSLNKFWNFKSPFVHLSHIKLLYMLFCFCLLSLLFWPCKILVPWLGIELGPSAVKAQSFNHWTTGNSCQTCLFEPQVPFGNSDMSLKGSHPLSLLSPALRNSGLVQSPF